MHIFDHRRLKNYQRSRDEIRAPLKCVTDALSQIDYTLDTMKTAKRFACANKGHFAKFMKGYAHGWVEDKPPTCFKTLRRLCVMRTYKIIYSTLRI